MERASSWFFSGKETLARSPIASSFFSTVSSRDLPNGCHDERRGDLSDARDCAARSSLHFRSEHENKRVSLALTTLARFGRHRYRFSHGAHPASRVMRDMTKSLHSKSFREGSDDSRHSCVAVTRSCRSRIVSFRQFRRMRNFAVPCEKSRTISRSSRSVLRIDTSLEISG